MKTFIKPMLWAGLGLLGVGAGLTNTADAKEPVKLALTESNRTDGHFETQTVYETRVDSDGRTFQVGVQRQVWVSDDDVYVSSPSYGYRYSGGYPYSSSYPYGYSNGYYGSSYYGSGYPYSSGGVSFNFGFGGGHSSHHSGGHR